MSYSDRVAGERRLAILQLLVEDGGHSNDRSLVTALRLAGHKINLDLDAVRALLTALKDRACVTVEMYRDTMMVATITERGRMAAAGHVSIDGISNPHMGL